MKIVIIGAGQVGSFLARELSTEHSVVIVDNDKERVSWVEDNYDVLAVHGNGEDPNILGRIEADKSDIMLAVSGEDKTNLLCTYYAHLHSIGSTVLRIRNPDYFEYIDLLNNPNISVVSPGEIISTKLVNLISAPFAWKAETFADEKVELFKLRVERNTDIVYKKLSELGPATSWIFVGVSKDGNISIPTGDTILEPGDYVYALGDPGVMKKLKKLFGFREEKITSTIIVGGGRLGRKAAATLIKRGISVKVIESNEQRAEKVAEEVSGASVFNGDATDEDILKEAGIESADYLIALTGDDEKNVFSALLAKNYGVKRTTVLYNKPHYIDVLSAIGVDRAISVRIAVANEILSQLHLGGVVHVSTVEEGKGEVLEFDITNDSKVTGKALKDIDFPDSAIVGICIRNNEVIIPRGDFVPMVNDRLIVFTLPKSVKKVEEILG